MGLEVPEDFDQWPYYFDITCDNCGETFTTTKERYKRNKHNFCSLNCKGEYMKLPPNCECAVCGKPLHRKPYEIKETKNITCSYDCCYKLKKITMAGENNHQYGLKGALNASYKDGTTISYYGYRLVYTPDHPYCNIDQKVFEHRLIAEQYLLDEINSIEINGKKYLRKEFAIHHIDFDRLNNNINNLCVLRKENHVSFHNSLITIIRKDKGRIKTSIKPQEHLSKEELRDKFMEYISKHNIYYHMQDQIRLIDCD